MLPIQERDANNNPLVTYTRGLDLSMSRTGAGGIGGILARTDTNSSTFYHADGNGNITAMIDGSQNIVARYEFDAFGRLIGKWGTMADVNLYRFSSKPYLPKIDGYDFGGRIYPLNLQRWLTTDPTGEVGGINLYGYVGNDPINNIDPDGLGTLRVNGDKSTVNTSQEFFNALIKGAARSGSIKTLDYIGHGDTKGALALSDQPFGTMQNWEMADWLKKYKGLFDKNAKIELDACGTANPHYKGNRVADAFKDALPGSHVWGFTGLDLFGMGVPNNDYFGHGEKVNGHPDSNIPPQSKWVEIK
jgi:RHS repeat-associated protein